jgi:hypothetical protein
MGDLSIAAVFAALHFVFLHGPDNQQLLLNVDEISSIRDPRTAVQEHFGGQVHCIVFMTNGKFVGTAEDCNEVLQKVLEIDKEKEKLEQELQEPITAPKK